MRNDICGNNDFVELSKNLAIYRSKNFGSLK